MLDDLQEERRRKKTWPYVSQQALLAALHYMQEEENEQLPGSAEVRELMLTESLPKIARVLARDYPDAAADAEDAVFHAVVGYLAKRASGRDIERADSYIFIAAKNFMKQKLERQVNREAGEEELPDETVASADAVALAEDTYQYCKSMVQRWESNRMREVTLLYLEATYLDEFVTQQEAADQISVLLDEEVPWTSIGKTRARGFARLRQQIMTIAQQTGINPIDGSETK